MNKFISKVANTFFEDENSGKKNDSLTSQYSDILGDEKLPTGQLTNEISNEAVDVNVNVEGLVNVEDIYNENDLGNVDNSVFKVDEIRQSLSSTLTTAAKKESTLGMLKVMKISLEDIQADAEKREGVLNGTIQKFVNETTSVVDEANAQIEQKLKEIEQLKQTIEDRNKLQEEEEKVVNNELTKIKEIKDFIL